MASLIRCLSLLALIALLVPSSALARSLYLTGDIGSAPVLLKIQKEGTALTGWYFHFRNGKEIRLEGKIEENGAFEISEYAVGNKKTGSFKGNAADGQWRGTWRKTAGGPALSINLRENNDALDSTQVACLTRKTDKQSGYSFSTAMHLTVDNGMVTRFAMTSAARSAADEQQCTLDSASLTQVQSEAGLLLQAKEASNERKCSVRIVGTPDHLYVALGDSSEPGNDCKGAGNTMFCSPRGAWNTLVVDRKKGTCIRVE